MDQQARNTAPPPVVIQIEAGDTLTTVLSRIIHPEENGPEYKDVLNVFKGACAFEYKASICCEDSLTLRTLNSENEVVEELQGPNVMEYLCCSPGSNVQMFSNGAEVLSFTYKSVMCQPICGNQTFSVELYLPTRGDPIGRIEYTGRDLTEREVKLTNYLTGENYIARKVPNTILPKMEIHDADGRAIGVTAVTSATVKSGTTTYKGIKTIFPPIGVSATTKCLLLVLSTLLKMDHQQSNMRCTVLTWLIIALLIGVGYSFTMM